MDLVIYGAQGMALGAYEAIHNLYPARGIRCFLVTERGINAEYLSGIPVLELSSFAAGLTGEEKEDIEVLITTPENVMSDIEKNLDAHGLHCHVRLTSTRWAKLMSYHYACSREFMPLSMLPLGYHRPELYLFMAKSYKDTSLKAQYQIPNWVVPIQVGASLCEERVAEILDCDGESISYKNKNYSELTALYWIWKNRLLKESDNEKNEYYGLVHYRRLLELSDDDVLRLIDNEVDAVLPYPMPYEPNIEVHHERYLKSEDWKAVLTALSELQPEYAKIFPAILQQKYLYNYNMILARKSILADYCGWLFPILERVEELSVPKASERGDRYIGYMGESLSTLYFLANRSKMNIVHAGCKFLT